jgi:hypothetical protein
MFTRERLVECCFCCKTPNGTIFSITGHSSTPISFGRPSNPSNAWSRSGAKSSTQNARLFSFAQASRHVRLRVCGVNGQLGNCDHSARAIKVVPSWPLNLTCTSHLFGEFIFWTSQIVNNICSTDLMSCTTKLLAARE